jgi:hypothetical protein
MVAHILMWPSHVSLHPSRTTSLSHVFFYIIIIIISLIVSSIRSFSIHDTSHWHPDTIKYNLIPLFDSSLRLVRVPMIFRRWNTIVHVCAIAVSQSRSIARCLSRRMYFTALIHACNDLLIFSRREWSMKMVRFSTLSCNCHRCHSSFVLIQGSKIVITSSHQVWQTRLFYQSIRDFKLFHVCRHIRAIVFVGFVLLGSSRLWHFINHLCNAVIVMFSLCSNRCHW